MGLFNKLFKAPGNKAQEESPKSCGRPFAPDDIKDQGHFTVGNYVFVLPVNTWEVQHNGGDVELEFEITADEDNRGEPETAKVYVSGDIYAPKKDEYKDYERYVIQNGGQLREMILYRRESRQYEGMSGTVPGASYTVFRIAGDDGTVKNLTLVIYDGCPEKELAEKTFLYLACNFRIKG